MANVTTPPTLRKVQTNFQHRFFQPPAVHGYSLTMQFPSPRFKRSSIKTHPPAHLSATIDRKLTNPSRSRNRISSNRPISNEISIHFPCVYTWLRRGEVRRTPSLVDIIRKTISARSAVAAGEFNSIRSAT